jgi:hypothetical protein
MRPFSSRAASCHHMGGSPTETEVEDTEPPNGRPRECQESKSFPPETGEEQGHCDDRNRKRNRLAKDID